MFHFHNYSNANNSILTMKTMPFLVTLITLYTMMYLVFDIVPLSGGFSCHKVASNFCRNNPAFQMDF